MNLSPKKSDRCLTLRFVREDHPALFEPVAESSWADSLAMLRRMNPTRVEWSYLSKPEIVSQIRETTPLFVYSLNPSNGHAEDFDGLPVIAPWMIHFGTPRLRFRYMCQNNPEDFELKLAEAVSRIERGIRNFHFDDWYCNAQMLLPFFKSACFCGHCMRGFAQWIGLDFDYRVLLRGKGFRTAAELFEGVSRNRVPLWEDYCRFQQFSVTLFFRRFRRALLQAHPDGVSISVNSSVLNERLMTAIDSIDYCNGEHENPASEKIAELAFKSRELGKTQIVLLCPNETSASNRDTDDWKGAVRRAMAQSYAMGMIPLYPWDVYMRNGPDGHPAKRWFGSWEDYGAIFEKVAANPEYFDDYEFESVTSGHEVLTILSRPVSGRGPSLTHTITPDGEWKIK